MTERVDHNSHRQRPYQQHRRCAFSLSLSPCPRGGAAAKKRWPFVLLLGNLLAWHLTIARAETGDRWKMLRDNMVKKSLVSAGITNDRVLESLQSTPRHQFVPRHVRQQSYYDMALPIGDGQTISSPFIVAFMTESLDPQPDDRVLEIGTGSGYQAAVLSPLVQDVYTIEIVESLGRKAAATLERLGYKNVHTKIGDGFKGWPEHAPFDKIIVTCSPEDVPQPLVDQLREGGQMVIPVGQRYQQTLYLFTKQDGKLMSEQLRPTLFVPMTGVAENDRDILPNPRQPELVNSSFEAPTQNDGFIPGWYYQRQAEQVADEEAPDGAHYVQFSNETMGRDAHLMQGLAIDGRHVRRIRISCWVTADLVRAEQPNHQGTRLVISFYDQDRRDLGLRWMGPWLGNQPWQHTSREFAVPNAAREMIVRIGLFGATGKASFDNVVLSVAR